MSGAILGSRRSTSKADESFESLNDHQIELVNDSCETELNVNETDQDGQEGDQLNDLVRDLSSKMRIVSTTVPKPRKSLADESQIEDILREKADEEKIRPTASAQQTRLVSLRR